MSSLPLIHGRIAAAPRHTLATPVINARHALVRHDMQRRTNRATFFALAILAATFGAYVAAFVI
jgi:hypothetical protein